MKIMTVEDLIIFISDPINKNLNSSLPPKDKSVIFSIAAQFRKSLSLTIKQANLILTILKRNEDIYKDINEFSQILENPNFKYPFRSIDTTKIVSISNSDDKQYISVRYPFDIKISKSLQKCNFGKIVYIKEKKTHLYHLNEQNISVIYEILSKYDFEFDKDFLNYLSDIEKIKNQPEEYLPLLDYDGDDFFLKNSHNSSKIYFDNNKTDNHLHNIAIAKILGLSMSRNTIDLIKNQDLSDAFKDILLTRDHKNNLSKVDFQSIVDFLGKIDIWPVLFVLEENNNLNQMIEEIFLSLKEIGIKNTEISTLFRSSNQADFNQYIKDKQLNNHVDENTKVVFIRHKIPKILYNINFKPKMIITNFSFHAHYTVKKMVDSHPFVLYYKNS